MNIYIIFGLIFYLAIVLFFIFAHFYKPAGKKYYQLLLLRQKGLIKLRGNFIIMSKIFIFASLPGSGQLKLAKIQFIKIINNKKIDLYV